MFKESYTDTVKVSGQLIKGLQFKRSELELEPFVYFHRVYQGTVCAEVSSIDGRYRSQFEVAFNEQVSGLTPLPFPTQYKDQLSAFKANELALLIWNAKTCQASDKQFFIASWGDGSIETSLQMLIRSSARRDVVTAKTKQSASTSSKCASIKAAYTVSFDKLCEVSGINLNDLSDLTLKRRNLRALPDVVVPLLNPTVDP